MKILITVNTAWNIQNYRKPLVKALLKRGYEVVILAPPDGTEAELVKMGCRFIPLQMQPTGMSVAKDWALFRRFVNQFSQIKPDVILSYTIKNNIYGAMAAKYLGLNFLPNISGIGVSFQRSRLLKFIVTQLYTRAMAKLPVVFFQNREDAALFVDRGIVNRHQPQLLPGSGIDLEHFHPEKPVARKKFQFLMLARLIEEKGVREFAAAAQRLRQDGFDAEFKLVGLHEPSRSGSIPSAEINAWQRENILTYCEHQQDVRALINQSDCVVLPSYREGVPRSLLEASAMARPIIASDVPGCRDAVTANVTGFLCAPKNVTDLTVQLKKMMEMPESSRQKMGQSGRKKMLEQFDQKFVVEKYLEEISFLVSNNIRMSSIRIIDINEPVTT